MNDRLKQLHLSQQITDGYNDFQITSIVAALVRYATAKQSYIDCLEFLKTQRPIVPKVIANYKISDDKISQMDKIIAHKKENFNFSVTCLNAECNDAERRYTNLFQ